MCHASRQHPTLCNRRDHKLGKVSRASANKQRAALAFWLAQKQINFIAAPLFGGQQKLPLPIALDATAVYCNSDVTSSGQLVQESK